MRILHTSDWHLGHVLHDWGRDVEHQAFLDWLLDVLVREEADALIVAGDIYETANPPAEAERRLYAFLTAAKQRRPHLDIVLIGGNHDSAARLDAPVPLCDALGIRVVGGLPRRDGAGGHDRLLVPLAAGSGKVSGWLVAVPFLRPADLPPMAEEGGVDPLVEGVRQIYAAAFDAARARRESGQALVATGHCYMTGTRLSELSERKVLMGNQHPLPADIFPPDATYAALGHLHLAQRVGGRDHVRYSGSPLPLSMAEAGYRHQVCLADFVDGTLAGVRSLETPRIVDLRRIPEHGAASLEDVLARCRALDPAAAIPKERQPFLEVAVRIEHPEPRLRELIGEALDDRAARLVKISLESMGSGRPLAEADARRDLGELTPEEVFQRRWEAVHGGAMSEELRAAFRELLDSLERGDPAAVGPEGASQA